MNGMTGSSWRFKRFDRICLTVNIDEFRSLGNQKINFDVLLKIEFIDKYAKINGSDDDDDDDYDDAMSPGSDEANYSDVLMQLIMLSRIKKRILFFVKIETNLMKFLGNFFLRSQRQRREVCPQT